MSEVPPGTPPEVEAVFKLMVEQLGNVAMHALKHQPENLAEIQSRIQQAEKMRMGLPNVVEAMEGLAALGEASAASLKSVLDVADAVGEARPEVYEVVSELDISLARALQGVIKQQAVIARSVRALAKTQISLARASQHYGSMLLLWVASEEFMSAAAQMGNRMGRGEDTLHEYARQKFGDALGDALTGHKPKEKPDADDSV